MRPRATTRPGEVPRWALEFLAGRLPDEASPAWDSYLGWRFFSEGIAGLPDADSPEGKRLIEAAKGTDGP